MWLDIAIAVSCCCCGLAAGWVAHAVGGFSDLEVVKTTPTASANLGQANPASPDDQADSLANVARQLELHISGMSANVDAHQTRVETINDKLRGDTTDADAVAEAVGQLIEANTEMQQQLVKAQEQIHKQTLELEFAQKKAVTDALTRIPNRGAFDAHISARHKIGPRTQGVSPHAGVLALLDVDHFKKFNDTYGHRAGDEVLKVVANLLHSRLHKYGLVARYGGEEFAVILDNVDLDTAAPIIDKVRAEIAERDIEFEGQSLSVSASIGVAELVDRENIEEWLQRADDGLYHSKEEGRNCGHKMTSDGPVRIGAVTTKAAHSSPEVVAASTGPFSTLPNHEAMVEIFKEVRDRAGDNVGVSIMAIRCDSKAEAAKLKALLPIVRTNLRNVDRLGAYDANTLLVCLPSIDDAAARDRGIQIRQAANAVGFKDNLALAMNVAQAGKDESFEQIVDRVIQGLSTSE
jgi:diguanylate cyclase